MKPIFSILTIIVIIIAASLLFYRSNQKDFENSTALLDRGRYHMERKEYREAIRYFERSIENKNEMIEAYKGLGWVYLNLHEFREAIRVYRELLDIDPGNNIAHNNIGFAFRMTNEPDSAVTAYEFALEWIPHDLSVLSRLGELYYNLGQYHRAAEISAQCHELEPQLIPCRQVLSKSYFIIGENYLQKGYIDSVDVIHELLLNIDSQKAKELLKLKNQQ